MTRPKIHPSADVQSDRIGDGTTIWQGTIVLPGARIGKDVNICAHCFVENDVEIGDRVTIKNGVQIWDGLRIGNDVFVGPNVTFTNDKFPRSKQYPEKYLLTRIGDRASIGGGAVILPGLTIGEGAMIGAGAVVTRSVPHFAIVVGSPARIIGYVEGNVSQHSPATEQRAFAADVGITRLGIGNVSLHRLKRVEDMRGSISVGEFLNDVPFTPKRYFLVYDVPSIETRGEHAHRQCHQFLVCVRGSCALVIDDGKRRSEMLLDGPDKGIYVPPMIWGTQYKYSPDAALLVFASEYYDAADYIRDYSEFARLVRANSEAAVISRRWLRFVVGGLLNTVATYVLYLGLCRLVSYKVAYSLAYGTGIGLAYLYNSRLVFVVPLSARRAILYPVVYGAQFLLSAGLLIILVEYGHLPAPIAPLIVLAALVPVSYGLNWLALGGRRGT